MHNHVCTQSYARVGYAKAWNSSWQFVERFGCLQIPAVYKQLKQNKSTPISFSFPTEKDEGRCAHVCVRAITYMHTWYIRDKCICMGQDMYVVSGCVWICGWV